MDYSPMAPYDWDINSTFKDATRTWMQCTGLHDNNEREIYEGDLVRINNAKHNVMIAWIENRYSFGYKYPTGEFQSQFSFYRGANGGSIKDVMEVVGNIYQNPELIK